MNTLKEKRQNKPFDLILGTPYSVVFQATWQLNRRPGCLFDRRAFFELTVCRSFGSGISRSDFVFFSGKMEQTGQKLS